MPNLRFPSGYRGDEIASLSSITAAITAPTNRVVSGDINIPAGFGCFVSAATTTADQTTTKAYYDLEYTWDFGDATSPLEVVDPTTESIVDATSQNGPEACYIYTTPGNYTITLTVRGWDGSSYVTDTDTIDVIVTDPADLVGRDIYVDPVDGSDAASDPSSSDTPLQTLAEVEARGGFTSGTRILVKAGTTAELPAVSGSSQINNPNPFILTTYGGSAKATLTCPTSLGTIWIQIACSGTAENVLFENIIFDMSTIASPSTADVFLDLRFSSTSTQNGFTIKDCELITPVGTVGTLFAPDLLDLNGTFEEMCFWNFQMTMTDTTLAGAILMAVQDGGWVNFTGLVLTDGTMSGSTNALVTVDGCETHQSYRWSGPDPDNLPSNHAYCYHVRSRGRVNPLATPVSPVTEFDQYILFESVVATGASVAAFYLDDPGFPDPPGPDPAQIGMLEDLIISGCQIYSNNAILGAPSLKSLLLKDNEVFDNATGSGKGFLAPLSSLASNTASAVTGPVSAISAATAAGTMTVVMLRNKMHKDSADVVSFLADNGFNTTRLIDNAFVSEMSDPVYGILLTTAAAASARLTIDYNRWYTDEASPFYENDDGTIANAGGSGTLSFANWQAAGYDTNGSLAATASQPFVDPAAGDFSETAVIPAAPTGLSATAAGIDQIDLSWTDNAGTETGYEVQRATIDATGPWTTVTAGLAANSTSYSNTGLSSNTQYWYRVRALGASGNSAWSNTATDTTDQEVPSAPGTPTLTVLSATSIRVQWLDNSTNEDDFEVERTGDSGGSPDAGSWAAISSSPVAAIAGSGSTGQVDDTGLTAETIYWYRVKATNSVAGDSSWVESAASATTFAAPPAAPSLLVQAAVSTTFVDLSWTDNASDEDSFEVQRAPDVDGAAGTYASIGSTSANVTTFRDNGLTSSATYWYRVRAVNAGGNSAFSNALSVTTSDAPITTGVSDEQVRKLEILWRAFNHRHYSGDDTVPFYEEYENENPAGTDPALVAPVCLSVGEIFGNAIATPAPGVTTADLEFVDCWPMYPRTDRSVSGGEIVFLAIRPVANGGTTDDEYGERLDKFIPPFYDSTYAAVVKLQPDDVVIDGDHASEAYFDYNTGVLVALNPIDLTGGKYLEITAHRYKGPTLATRLAGIGGGATGADYTRFDLITLSSDQTSGVAWTLPGALTVGSSQVNDLDTNFVQQSMVFANGNKLVYGLDYTLSTQNGVNKITLLNGSAGGGTDRYVGRDCDEIEVMAVIT